MKIRMSEAEEELFKAFVGRSEGYFEYGLGGSTVYASSVVKGPVYGVDSDPAWVESVQKSFDSSAYDRHLIHVDIGPTKEWGHPVSIDEKEKFPAYYESIIGFSDKIDLCLVDGRFRLACFFQALLTLRSDAIIGIHDYRSRRHYHSVEKFARPIAENGDMTFFNRRLGIDLMSVKKALEKVAYSPA